MTESRADKVLNMRLNMFAGLIIFLLFFSGSTAGFTGGSGTSNDPYQIETCQQLQNMSNDLDANYELVSDIDCSDTENWNSGKGFDPIGGQNNEFKGDLDGNYYDISDLYMNRAESRVGLFGQTYDYVEIGNLSISNANITNNGRYTGVLAGINWADVKKVYASGNITTGDSSAGGLFGRVGTPFGDPPEIKKSYSRVGIYTTDTNIGGIIGSNRDNPNLSQLYATGKVSGSGNKGGLLGYTENNNSQIYWDVNTSGRSSSTGVGPELYTGLTTSEMKNKSNLKGFDFENTWVIDPEINDGYPQLQAFVSPDISEFSAEKIEGSKLQVTVKSSQTLKILNVSISGSESAILNSSDFVHTTESNTEVYRANYTYSKDGVFKATLDAARSQKESAEASGQTDLAFCDRSAESPSCTVDSSVWNQGNNTNTSVINGSISLQTGGITLTSHDVSVGGYKYDAFIRDLDQDGDKDVIVVNDLDKDNRWLENNGSGVFTEKIVGTNGGGSSDAAIADFDGDGDKDIVTAVFQSGGNYWFENDGSESFTSRNFGKEFGRTVGVDTADFDGDGDKDIVLANQDYANVQDAWLENDGTGSFTRHDLGPKSSRETRDVEAADFDNDGDIDIFAASSGDSYLWENDGSGNFVNYSLGGSSTDTEGSAVFDIDGDGDLDIVEANHNQNNYWWENDGSGNFTHHSLNDGTRNNYDIDAADLDGDGDGDIVVSTNNNNDYWLENDGSESFTRHVFTGSKSGRGVDIGDLDGDNDPDIFLPNADEQAKWWENTIDYKAGGNYSSTVFEGLKSVYWSNITVDSELNGGSANVTFEFSEQSDFSSTVSSKTFELSGGEQNLSTGTEARYVRFNISMAPGSSTPVIDSMDLRYKKSDPKLKTQNQEREVTGPDIENNLSIVVSDLGSGIDRVYLETNESGAFKNRSGYTEDLSGPTSDTLVDFDWGNSSLKGQNLTIGWKVWAVDKTGNWNSSGVETFEFDGYPPSTSNQVFDSNIDVDDGSTQLSIDISDKNGVDSVLIEENSSGSFSNSSMSNSSGTYSYTISRSSLSDVSFSIYANDTVGNLKTISGNVNFQNISLSQNFNDTFLNSGGIFELSGSALLEPDNAAVQNQNLSVYFNGSFIKSQLTDGSGDYRIDISAPQVPGIYDVKVNLSDSNNVSGLNVSEALNVFNLSTSIKSASNYNVFRDTDSSEDISFSDNVTADSRNPGSLNGVNLVYSIPSSWTYVSKDESSNTLAPGEFFSNSPKVDIGADASLGPIVVNTTASSNEGVSSTDNITINIWEKADAEFLNIEDGESIPRDKKYMELRANITGVSSNTGLDNVSTRLIDSAQSYTESSNSSGIVTYNWSVKDLNTGDNQVSLQTQDQVSQYINSTGDLFEQRITVSVLGILKSGHFSISQDSVYRKNGSSPEDTQISGQIEDSNGDGVNQTDVYIDINGTVLHDITDKTGSYSVFYNPPDSMEPGNYTVNVNASKSDFDVLEFNDSVVVKGKASTTNLVSKKIFRRGLPQQLDSFIANEFGDQASLSTKWYLNGSEVATGQNTSWIPSNSVSRGFYNLKVGTDSQFYDNQNDTSQIEVYGLAEIDLKPDTTSILPGNQVDVHVNVSDANTSAPVNGMPVDIFINGTKYTSQTNSSGIAEYDWNPSEGFYNVSAAIQSNKSLRYNVSNSFESSDVTIGKNIYLDSFSITNDEIFRPDLNTYTTKFSVNLSETSSSPENVPGDGINVSFTINGSETVECQTDSLGYCEVNYNPQNVEIGDLDVDLTTSKTDWDDIEETKTLTVKGVMTPKIQKPENSIINRGTNITLETTTSTFSGGEANVPVNWSFRGSQIATGKTAYWKPQTIGTSTGPGTLEVSAGEGGIYQEGTDTFEVTVYGLSTVEIESPNNSSKIGYGQSPTLSCHVTDSVDRDIENYPVEFVDNRSGSLTVFANDLTDSNGDATANWDVPNSLGSFRAGCRIADNASLGYNDSTAVSTRVFETKDDVPPSVTNISVPSKVDPGDVATVNFNATDEIEVDRAWIIVEDPNLQEERVFASAVDSDTFKAEYNTSGHPEGGYTVKVRANDTSGNLEKKLDTFNVNPGGSISVSQSLLAVSGITQTQGNNYTVDVSVRINETGGANLVNITSSSSNSSKLDINKSKYTCGSKARGDYCNRTFKLEVLPGALASPPSVFATFEGEWIAGDSSSVNTFTELNIQRNPKLSEEAGNQSFNINHDNSNQVSFTPNATGNYQVEDFYASYISGNLSESWIDLSNDRKSSIDPGSSISTGANVSIPLGQDPGVYVGKINFSSNNTGSLNRQIKATVLEDFSYSVPSTVSVTAIKGASGDLKDVPITHNGNKDFTANPTFSGDVSGFVDADSLNVKKQEMNQLTVYRTTPFSSAGNYSTTLTVDSSNPSVSSESVTLDIEVLDFSIGVKTPGTTVNTEPGNYSTAKFNVSVGGTKRTDNLTNNIYVNGTKAKINSENENNGVFTINFTVPDIADARKHDLEIEVEDGKNDVTASETINDRFNVPDSTNPVVSKIDTENIDVGENVTINLTASDNNLNGVLDGIENVSLTLTDPSDSSSIYYMENEGQEWQQKLINLSEKGNYRLEFNVTDAANLSTIKTDYLRVAPRFNLGGSFKDSIGKTQTADVVFVEEETRERTNAKLNGDYNISIQTGTYDVEINHSDNKINLEGVEVNQNTSDPIKVEELDQIDTSSLTPDAEARVMGMGVNTSFNPSSATITFNYSEYKNNIPSGKNLEDLQVARCPEYDYSDRSCGGNFETFNITSGNIDTKREVIEVNVSGFSSYTLFFPDNSEDKIENNDEQEQQQEEDTSGGGGGGGGGLSSRDLEGIEDTLSEINSSLTQNQSQYAEFGSNTISARMKPGETKQVSLSIRNRYNKSQTFSIKSSEVVSEFIEEPSSVNLESGEVKDIILGITVPASELPNSYSGYLNVKSEKIDTNIPVNLNVLPPDKKLLDLSVDPVFESVTPGDTLKVETTFSNQGYARNVDVTVQVEVVDPDTNETVAEKEKTLAVGTTLTRVVSLQIPDDAPNKRYEVRGSARYTNLDVPMVATAVTPVNVQTPFWERSFFEVKYDTLGITLLLILVTSLVGYSVYQYRKQKALEKKRYLEKIDLDTIPSGGKNQAFVGELAEMGKRTFIDLNDLTTHALVAGATGSGKTVTGQGMVEEALKEGKNVIVLDPTAQWTGFLRENSDSAMFQLYKEHGMSMDDAQGFDGNIRAIEPGEEIDITPYLETDEEGQIIVFSLHKLDSKNIDEFVNKTIQQIFDANLPERNGLETLVVYDEVHRLLEKFGGSGEGLKQLERGAREFRKWGVGMVLLSQVITDFSGEIRANIGTMIQMRTQYEKDLNRVKDKFGMDTVRSIAKAKVGAGMVQNSDYNHGRPYFVDFRPLLHSPHRLSDEELEKYETYNRRVDSLEERIDSMEQQGEEVYEYRSELKLAKRNLKKASFNLVDIYLDELEDDLK